MPIYEYACGSCEHRFETIQKASEQPLRDCPGCGEEALKKLLSAPVFRLKGSGWYETDFKTSDKRNVSDGSDGPEAADKGGKAEPDAKADKAEPAGPAGKKDKNGSESKASESSSKSDAASTKSDAGKQANAPAKG